ncbi:MAG: hypothetical protein ACYCY3_03160 [Halothiobacillus sp.]
MYLDIVGDKDSANGRGTGYIQNTNGDSRAETYAVLMDRGLTLTQRVMRPHGPDLPMQ